MKKFSILKLVDEAILPVILVIGAKLAAIFIITLLFNIPWSLTPQPGGFGLYFIYFSKVSDVFFLASLSDLAMVVTCATGFVWVLFRGSYFGQDQLHPVEAAKLHKKGRENLIISLNETYHQALVWLSLSWFTLFLIAGNTLNQVSSLVVFGVALIATLSLTLVLLENIRAAKH